MNLPAVLRVEALPGLVEHLLAVLDPGADSPALDAPPDRVERVRSDFQPLLEWERKSWKSGRSELSLRVPQGERNRELSLVLSFESGLQIELAGPGSSSARVPLGVEGEIVVAKIRAASETERASAEAALDEFFRCDDVPLLRLPSTPRKWSRLGKRFTAIPRALLPLLPNGAPARLAADRERRPYYLLAAQPEGHVALGCLYMHGPPVRLTLSLERGHPLPRLIDFFPTWPDIDAPVEDVPDFPPSDASFGEKDHFGLLRARTGARGRERLEAALWIEDLIREARFSTVPGAEALDPDDARAPWTVEWCVAGNINYLSGHPGGGDALFASSLPPAADERRRFDLVLFGMTELLFERWQELFARAGLELVH